jgi:hypothetical protein
MEISDDVAVIVIRVSDTMYLVAENQVCVAETNRSVTDINVYTSHIGVCVTGPDANTAEIGDFVIETGFFISVLKLLFPILRWACITNLIVMLVYCSIALGHTVIFTAA